MTEWNKLTEKQPNDDYVYVCMRGNVWVARLFNPLKIKRRDEIYWRPIELPKPYEEESPLTGLCKKELEDRPTNFFKMPNGPEFFNLKPILEKESDNE